MTILNTLPEDHHLRNTPLGVLNAEYQWVHGNPKLWRTVRVGAPKLVPFTFNQLGEAWTKWDTWRIPE